MDVRPGGAWSARMLVGDERAEIPWHGSYREVDPPGRLVLTLADRPGDEFELVTVVLTDVQEGTRMTFTQIGGHMPPEEYARAEEAGAPSSTTWRDSSPAIDRRRPDRRKSRPWRWRSLRRGWG